jgi:hypothetical protein
MARIVALNDIDPKLKQYLSSVLRVNDEAIVLPQAHRSQESGVVKNVVMRLSGSEDGLDPEVFNPAWFSGVSVVSVPTVAAEQILSNCTNRQELLQKLKEAIPSEMADSQVTVGPDLQGDAQDRDIEEWTAGFDGPSCCVGLYSAVQNRSPDPHASGMSRAHKAFFLVCKAGSGIAGQTFHARLSASLRKGQTLDNALADDGTPGSRALRRLSMAGRRNRSRILVAAAEALGLQTLDTIGDNASPTTKPYRIAIPSIDSTYNALVNVEEGGRKFWQYTSGCIETSCSTGCITSSNASEGFVAFVNANGELRFLPRNEAHSVVPFCSERLKSNRDAVMIATEAHKNAKKHGRKAHPDSEWVFEHFSWNPKNFQNGVDVEPPGLWGSHASENFAVDWSRELGLSCAHAVRLQPEVVAISAVEPSKLRVATKAIALSIC